MPAEPESFRRRYTKGLWSYVAKGGEDLRELALSLGREALEAGMGILDLALLQKDAAAGLEPGPAQDRAAEFFAEALAAYEMRLRGAQDAFALVQLQNQALEASVAERTRSLEEKEAQLHHAQKLDAMGRLAGGVAHDFNNLLTIMLGYSQLGQESLESGDLASCRLSFTNIHNAVERGSELTQQLLAFSRKGSIEPRTYDLGREVADAVALLRRLVGEGIQLELAPPASPCGVHVDRGQLHQVVMNLVINARDALPQGGHIRVATTHALLSPGHLTGYPDARPGLFGLLSVADDGSGMDAAIQAKVFEPFFTTKPAGRGTGLGLSTVYGIVTQNRGLVRFHSEPGKGTTFKVYLPSEAPP